MAEGKHETEQKKVDEGQKNSKNPDKPNQGAVEHSDDGRLKENREKGVHRGDKE